MSKDNHIFTHIGSEILVSVYFDYQPAEEETSTDPAVPSEVIINSVSTMGNGSDILECLNDEWLQILEERCEEDYHEMSWEEP